MLAVGDMSFQKKLSRKNGRCSEKEGRTVLFVTHNIAAAQALCNKGIS